MPLRPTILLLMLIIGVFYIQAPISDIDPVSKKVAPLYSTFSQ